MIDQGTHDDRADVFAAEFLDQPDPPPYANMTPDELTQARHRLGLSQEQLAAMGEMFSGCVAASGRTVRRWESGTRQIPGPVVVLVNMALASAEVRRLLGLQAWKGDCA